MTQSHESCAAWGIVVLLASPVYAQQLPTFKSGVDLVRLDVTVVDADGKPVDGLEPRDFDVRVNGVALPVTTLRYLDLGSLTRADAAGASTSIRPGHPLAGASSSSPSTKRACRAPTAPGR